LNTHHGASTRPVGYRDLTHVSSHDLEGDGQTEPGAPAGARAIVVEPNESLQSSNAVSRRNSRTVIGNGENSMSSLRVNCHIDSRRRVTRSIVE